MVAEPETVVRLTRLKTDLAGDRAAMDARESEVGELVRRWDQAGSLGRPELVLIAVNLHGSGDGAGAGGEAAGPDGTGRGLVASGSAGANAA